jgi:hypothetical protein
MRTAPRTARSEAALHLAVSEPLGIHIRRVGVRVATVTRPRTAIDTDLRDRRCHRPRCPVSRLGRSHLRAGLACQVNGDPTYLIAAEASILRVGRRCINIHQAGRLHLEPTAGLLAADIAKVPLITARRPADLAASLGRPTCRPGRTRTGCSVAPGRQIGCLPPCPARSPGCARAPGRVWAHLAFRAGWAGVMRRRRPGGRSGSGLRAPPWSLRPGAAASVIRVICQPVIPPATMMRVTV